jgi:hypothetical protein
MSTIFYVIILILILYFVQYKTFYIWKSDHLTLFSASGVEGIILQNKLYIYQHKSSLYYTLRVDGTREYYRGKPFAELKSKFLHFKTAHYRNIADFIKKNVFSL